MRLNVLQCQADILGTNVSDFSCPFYLSYYHCTQPPHQFKLRLICEIHGIYISIHGEIHGIYVENALYWYLCQYMGMVSTLHVEFVRETYPTTYFPR